MAGFAVALAILYLPHPSTLEGGNAVSTLHSLETSDNAKKGKQSDMGVQKSFYAASDP